MRSGINCSLRLSHAWYRVIIRNFSSYKCPSARNYSSVANNSIDRFDVYASREKLLPSISCSREQSGSPCFPTMVKGCHFFRVQRCDAAFVRFYKDLG